MYPIWGLWSRYLISWNTETRFHVSWFWGIKNTIPIKSINNETKQVMTQVSNKNTSAQQKTTSIIYNMISIYTFIFLVNNTNQQYIYMIYACSFNGNFILGRQAMKLKKKRSLFPPGFKTRSSTTRVRLKFEIPQITPKSCRFWYILSNHGPFWMKWPPKAYLEKNQGCHNLWWMRSSPSFRSRTSYLVAHGEKKI